MDSAKFAARNVGRIGALAVALGVGAAVTGVTGVAYADTTGQQDTGDSTPARHSARTAAAAAAQSGAGSGRTTGQRHGALPAAAATAPATKNRAPSPSAVASAVDVPTISASPTAELAATNSTVTQRVLPSLATHPIAVDPVSAGVLAVAPTAAVPALVTVPVGPASAAPATTAAPQAAVSLGPQAAPTRAKAETMIARLVDAVRSAALGAGSGGGSPAGSPALWALLAWARRDRSGPATAVVTQPAAALAAASTNLTTQHVGWVTGQRNNAVPGATWTQTNNTKWANVYGTDLGIMWQNGDNGLTQLAFGDTFSGANMTGDWRSNVLLLSNDTNLTDGLSLINTGPAYQFIPAARNQVFFIGSEVTNIPTSALYANSDNYVSYMSVKSWDTPGRWTTNYSAVSKYDPIADKWVLQKSTIRSAGWFRASKAYNAGDQNFQQMAYVLQPEAQVAPGGTRYVYAFGTPAGRAGSAFLSRVPEGAVTDLKQYEYWDGSKWVKNEAKAAPVLGDSTRSAGLLGPIRDIANNPKFFGGWFAGLVGAKTGGNVSEMSVQYNDYLGKYVVLYGNGANNVILRTADTPEGTWSDPITIATSLQYPGLYAPMIHPLSGTGDLTDSKGDPDVSHLYWNMSIWSNYNVVLMQTDLAPLKATLT